MFIDFNLDYYFTCCNKNRSQEKKDKNLDNNRHYLESKNIKVSITKKL